MKKFISFQIALATIISALPGFCTAGAEDISVNDINISSDNIAVVLSDTLTGLTGAAVNGQTCEVISDGSTVNITYDKENLEEKNIISLSTGTETVYIKLEKNVLLSDNFDEDADGWEGGNFTHNASDGTLVISAGSSGLTYYNSSDVTKEDQSLWQDYVLEFDIKNVNPEYSLYTDVRSSFGGDAYRAALRSYDGTYWQGLYPSRDELTAFSRIVFEDREDTEYVKYLGETAKADVDVRIEVVGETVEMYADDELVMSNSFDICAYGGIAFSTEYSANDVIIDNLSVSSYTYSISQSIPYADNLRFEETDGMLKILFDYSHSDDVAIGETVYEWYYKPTGGEFMLIEGNAGDTLDLTSFEDCIIKCVVTPVDESGNTGLSEEAEYIPVSAPYIEGDVLVNGSSLIGNTLSVTYEFADKNGDSDAGSKIEWLSADTADGEYTTLIDSETLDVTDSLIGKYIKARVTPISSSEPYEGEAKTSSNYIYISDKIAVNDIRISGSQMLIYPAEEAADNIGVYFNNTLVSSTLSENCITASLSSVTISDSNTVKITNGAQETLATISRSIYLEDNFNDDLNGWVGSRISHDADEGRMVIAKDSYSLVYYNGSDASKTAQSDWSNYTVEFTIYNEDGKFKLFTDTRSSFNHSSAYRFAINDHNGTSFWNGIYFSANHATVLGTAVLDALASTDNLNYLGKMMPAMPMKVRIEVYDNSQKLYIDNELRMEQSFNNLTKGGVAFNTLGSASPVLIDDLSIYEYKYTFDGINSIPTASGVTISGTLEEGETLSGSYTYSHPEGIGEDINLTKYVWYASDSEFGKYDKVAEGSEITVTSAMVNKFIKLYVTPVDSNGVAGITAMSGALTKEWAPEATGVIINGNPLAGLKLTAGYSYYDANGDAEAETEIKWYISDSEAGAYTEITGETSEELTVTEAMTGKYIKVAVTPKAQTEPAVGITSESEPVLILSKAAIKNLQIKKVTAILYRAEFQVDVPAGIEDYTTEILWYVKNSQVGSGASIEVSPGNYTLTVHVTPKLPDGTAIGETAVKSITISTSSSPSPGGSGGGGGGGGGGSAQVSAVVSEVLAQPEAPVNASFTDTKEHWVRKYAETMLEKGIMSGTDKSAFMPDMTVTRAEFVSYIVKAMGLTETSFTAEFKDVKPGYWFAPSVQAALENNIISADEYFMPFSPVTREQIAKIVCGACGIEASSGDLSKYADAGEVDEWAKPYVYVCTQSGLMTGTGDNRFNPKGYITRAEAAVILARITEKAAQ